MCRLCVDDTRSNDIIAELFLLNFLYLFLKVGTGAAPSKVGGWISNVWGYAATPKKNAQEPPSPVVKIDPNQV